MVVWLLASGGVDGRTSTVNPVCCIHVSTGASCSINRLKLIISARHICPVSSWHSFPTHAVLKYLNIFQMGIDRHEACHKAQCETLYYFNYKGAVHAI